MVDSSDRIARKGLVTPLPEGWKPCAAPSGELYYFNFGTGESVWEHPGDECYRALHSAISSGVPSARASALRNLDSSDVKH